MIASYLNSMEWLKSGLFWRTFFMLAALVMASMLLWFASFRSLERTPRAQQLSSQIVSIVTVSRAALAHSPPENSVAFLTTMARNEGVRITTLHREDVTAPLEKNAFNTELGASLTQTLGADTRFARQVNGENGFWISFRINDQPYWLRLDTERIEPPITVPVISWAAATLLLTLLGAVIISKLINDPLAQLSQAAYQIAQGKRPQPLPERGPKEIRETNTSFNSMVEDLARIETDRTIILAGISHDLRTPLARMQLEVEMADLDPQARAGMQSDLVQMDAIINQFLDYAKPLDNHDFEPVEISELLLQVIKDYASRISNLQIRTDITPGLIINGNETELHRLFSNLIENACRYGKNPDRQTVLMEVQCSLKKNGKKQGVLISFRDYGDGAPDDDINRLLRPFTRADASRSQANGSGLGLAIVDRIIKRHRGRLRIYNHEHRGFVAVMIIPEHRSR